MVDKWQNQKLTPGLPGFETHALGSFAILIPQTKFWRTIQRTSKRLSKICLPIKVPPKSEAGLLECQAGLCSLTISTCSWDRGSRTTISAGTVCSTPTPGSGECLPRNTRLFSAKWLKENLSSWSLLSSGQASFPGRGTPPLTLATTQRGSGRAEDKVIPRPNTTAVSTDQQ